MAKEKENEMNIKLENSKILKVLIETLSNIIDETVLKITPNELVIKAMDPSRICLLKIRMAKFDFDEFDCKGEISIGLNLDDLNKILKRSGKDDSIELSFKENSQKLKIQFAREKRKRTFSLSVLDLDIEEIPMDNLLTIDYETEWKMNLEILVEAIKDAEIYSELINIKVIENQGIIFSSIGQIGEMEYSLEVDDLIENNIYGESEGAFSTDFLKKIFKLSSIIETFTISAKTDNPLRIDFEFLEGGVLNYFLAPRIDSDVDVEELEELEEIEVE